MRARIFRNPEAWRVLQLGRPRPRLEYDPAEFRSDRDEWGDPLRERDPRAIEAELGRMRDRFWRSERALEVRLAARRAVKLARHLEARAVGSS